MKTIIIAVGIVITMGVLVHVYDGNTHKVVTNVEREEVIKEVTPDWATDEDAVKAAQDVIRKKELEAELQQLQSEVEEREVRITEIEKELGTYWTQQNVKALIRQTFPEEPAKAIAIAYCESGLRPNAFNPHNRDGSTDAGLWQINSVHDSRLNELGLDKYDVEDATKYARMLYDEAGGWRDWVCHNKGLHLAYLR